MANHGGRYVIDANGNRQRVHNRGRKAPPAASTTGDKPAAKSTAGKKRPGKKSRG